MRQSTLFAAALVALCAAPAAADPICYFSISSNGFTPVINNGGEIVYLGADGLTSTRRGELVPLSDNIRFPDINDLGEVVYSDVDGPGGLRVYSNERGFLFYGNQAGLNNAGDVSANGSLTPGNFGVLEYHANGTVSEIAVPAGAGSTKISDSGEVTYVTQDSPSGPRNVFSTTRGQLTTFSTSTLGAHSANNVGQFVYTTLAEDGFFRLFSGDGHQLWDGPVGAFADLNDYGDVVFNPLSFRQVGVEHFIDDGVMLMTMRPEVYDADGIQRVPEPSPALLIGLAFVVGGCIRTWKSGRRPA